VSVNVVEPSIAVDPADPNILAIFSQPTEGINIGESISSDGGKTWSYKVIATGAAGGLPGSEGVPTSAFDAFGNLFVAYADVSNTSVDVAMSTDGGKTMTLLATVNGIGIDPRLVVGPGGSVAPESVWVEGHSTVDFNVVASGAPIHGLGVVGSFVPLLELPGTNASSSGQPSIGPKGQFTAVYESANVAAGPGEIFIATAPEGLASSEFSAPVDVTTVNIGPNDPVTPQPKDGISTFGGLAYDDSNGPHSGRLYLVKTDTEPLGNPDTALFVEFSDDNGATWSVDVDADDSGGNSSLILPSIAVDPTTGVLGLSWLDARNDPGSGSGDTDGKPDTDVEEFATISVDGGNSFLKNVQVATGPSNAITDVGTLGGDDDGFDFGNFTGLAFFNNVMYPAWPDNSKALPGNPAAHNFNIAVAPVTVTGGPSTGGGLQGTGIPITGTAGTAITTAVADFTGNTLPASDTNYPASISWGDGQFSTGSVVALPAGGFDVTGTHTYTVGGKYNIVVTVLPQNSPAPSLATTTANISAAPLIGVPTSFTGTEGVAFNGVVASFTDTATGPTSPSNYNASINWGDGTTTSGVIIADTSGDGGEFSVLGGGHVLTAGHFTVVTTISAIDNAQTTVKSTDVVADQPLTGSASSVTGVEAQNLNAILATFTDPLDPRNESSANYSATVAWGDGTTSAGTIEQNPSGPGFAVVGNHPYSANTYQTSITISDKGGASITVSGSAQITDVPITATPINASSLEGVPISGFVASFHDADTRANAGSQYTVTIDWGDGTTSTGTAVPDGRGRGGYLVQSGHTYSAGTYTTTITVKDTGGASDMQQGTVTVTAAPLTVTALPAPTIAVGVPFTAPIATFVSPNPKLTAADFSATIDWGDGTTTAGTVSMGASGGFSVNGNHLYAHTGAFSITVSASSTTGETGTGMAQVSVADAPIIAVGHPVTFVEKTTNPLTAVATFGDANLLAVAGDFSETIDWGDGSSSEGTIGTRDSSGAFPVFGTHIYAESGSYSITVTIQDVGGSQTVANGTATVSTLAFPISGGLASGQSYTNNNQPLFAGSSEPLAHVQLFAGVPGRPGAVLIGSGQADGNGHWVARTSPLPDGVFVIYASATDSAGQPSSPITQIMPGGSSIQPLVVDTAGPHILSAVLNPSLGTITVVIQDSLSGVSPAASVSPAAFSLATANGLKPIPILGFQVVPEGSNQLQVTLAFATSRRVQAASYVLRISAASVTDLAGNPLSEHVFVPFTGMPPGPVEDYVAQFSTNGRAPAGPQVFIPASSRLASQRQNQLLRRLRGGR
jgi:hypothetical protein